MHETLPLAHEAQAYGSHKPCLSQRDALPSLHPKLSPYPFLSSEAQFVLFVQRNASLPPLRASLYYGGKGCDGGGKGVTRRWEKAVAKGVLAAKRWATPSKASIGACKNALPASIISPLGGKGCHGSGEAVAKGVVVARRWVIPSKVGATCKFYGSCETSALAMKITKTSD